MEKISRRNFMEKGVAACGIMLIGSFDLFESSNKEASSWMYNSIEPDNLNIHRSNGYVRVSCIATGIWN